MLVNVFRSWKFPVRGGQHQGDPQIFVLVTNGLNHMISKCYKTGLINGLGCRDNTNSVINLQFMGDILVFGKESLPQTMILKWTMFCFERWSGLKINFHKNSLVSLGEISVCSFLISIVFSCPIQWTLICPLWLAYLRWFIGEHLLTWFRIDLRRGKGNYIR